MPRNPRSRSGAELAGEIDAMKGLVENLHAAFSAYHASLPTTRVTAQASGVAPAKAVEQRNEKAGKG